MESSTLHDELLAEFHAKVAAAKRLRQQSMSRHRANLELSQRKKSEEFLREQKQEHSRNNRLREARSATEVDVLKGIETVEANLRRLGLDNVSTAAAPPQPTHASQARAPERFRPSVIHGSSIGGGLVTFLRRTGEHTGLDGTSLYKAPQSPLPPGKQKLTGPKVLYPTVRVKSEESDDDTPVVSHPEENLALNAEYLARVRARKEEDVRALREREVRRHRMNGEQSRSKNQVLEQKELEKLLLRAKIINAPDRQRVIDKRIEGIQRERDRKLRAEMMMRRKEASSPAVEAALNRHRSEAFEQRSADLAEFLVVRQRIRAEEEVKKTDKLNEKIEFCRQLVCGVVSLVGEVIDRSTTYLQDGSEQYNRVSFGVTEWRKLVARHLLPVVPKAQPMPPGEDSVNAGSFARDVPAKEHSHPVEVNVQDVVNGDLEVFLRLSPETSNVRPRSLHAVFVGGDPVISGVDLLAQNGDASIISGVCREYLLITPSLVRHLEFQAAKRSIDESLEEVEESILQITSDLQAKQALLASQTPAVKGKKDSKVKDASPLAQSVMQLASALSELTQKQGLLKADETKLRVEAALREVTDAELGTLVGKIIVGHGKRTVPYKPGEAQTRIPLSFAHIVSNPDLANAVLIFAGFPLTEEFGAALAECGCTGLAYCELGCDAVSALQRMDGVQEFTKYPPPPTTIVEPSELQGKRKGTREKGVAPTPAPVVCQEPPKAILAHPLLSPLEVYRGEAAEAPTSPVSAPGRASPMRISIPQVSATPCPDVNDLEYATSPHLQPHNTDRSTSRAVFTKFLRWYSGKEPTQFEWLWNFSHFNLAGEAKRRMDDASRVLGVPIRFEVSICDASIGLLDGIVVRNTRPGSQAVVPHQDDSIYFSQFAVASSLICSAIAAGSQSPTEDCPNDSSQQAVVDDGDVASAAIRFRSNLVTGFQAVELCLRKASCHLCDLTNCFPVSVFSLPPTETEFECEEDLSLARWKLCDAQRKKDMTTLSAFVDELDTTMTHVRSQLEVAFNILVQAQLNDNMAESYYRHGATMLESLVSRCRVALREWCLHLFTLHCEVIRVEGGYFAATETFRPINPAEVLNILNNSMESRRALSFMPATHRTKPTELQMNLLLWAFSSEGKLESYTSSNSFKRGLNLVQLLKESIPSLVPVIPPRTSFLNEGEVAVGWFLLKIALGSSVPSPTLLQATQFAAALAENSLADVSWWTGVDDEAVANIAALGEAMTPGSIIAVLLAFLASDVSSNKLSALRRWFTVIGSYERRAACECSTLTVDSLCRYFPKGAWSKRDLHILNYLTGGASNLVTFEALSSTPFGEMLVSNAAMEFVL